MLNILMLCCTLASMGATAQREAVSDRVTWRGLNDQRPKSLVAVHRPTGPLPLALLHAAAAGSDAFTTRRMAQRGFSEQDPLVRPLIGVQPTYGRMVPLGVAEVGLTYFLAKRYPKLRWLQLGLAITHTSCAIHNSRL